MIGGEMEGEDVKREDVNGQRSKTSLLSLRESLSVVVADFSLSRYSGTGQG
jgi:hypothetical protein